MSQLTIDARAAGQSYDPYWKRVICGDRVGLAVRADFREHLQAAVRACGFKHLRQHGLFHDDMFVWPAKAEPFNFQYVDYVYDYYLSLGIRPFVELSFLPRWMASNEQTVFTVKCPACPPTDLHDWHTLVHTTVQHLVERYGLDEVRAWHFEVWNEPNIPFWSGTQQEYFELYRSSVDAVKSVDASLRIGGPATANFVPDASGEFRPVWVEEFMAFCQANDLPADFVSTHPYPTDFPFDEATGTWQPHVRERNATYQDLKLLREIVDAGPFPQAEIHCDEWGTSPSVRDRVHDHVFSATFHLENLLGCLGLVDSLARWVSTDVSEEQTPGPSEFHGGWGLQTIHGLKKPDFHAYAFLNRLGGELLHNGDGVAVARNQDGWQVLLYNHHHYASSEATWETLDGVAKMIGGGDKRRFTLTLEGLPPRVQLTHALVDAEHGWVQRAWQELGLPDFPTPRQLDALRGTDEPAVTTTTRLTDQGRLDIDETLQPLGMLLIEIEKV